MTTTGTTSSGAAQVTVRYWAGAKAAAGRGHDELPLPDPGTVAAVLHVVVETHPALAGVLQVASVLLDGRVVAVDSSEPVAPRSVLEVLPPFAGG